MLDGTVCRVGCVVPRCPTGGDREPHVDMVRVRSVGRSPLSMQANKSLQKSAKKGGLVQKSCRKADLSEWTFGPQDKSVGSKSDFFPQFKITRTPSLLSGLLLKLYFSILKWFCSTYMSSTKLLFNIIGRERLFFIKYIYLAKNYILTATSVSIL